MLQESILQYFQPSLELPFVVKTFVLSVFEWPLKTGFTVTDTYLMTINVSRMFELHVGLLSRFSTW